MMEMFRSIFPNTWHYLAVTTATPEDVSGMLNYAVYELHGNVEEDYIYVIEDSDMDLGLLEAVEKIKQESRRYAKRQLTWFNHMEVKWFYPDKQSVSDIALEICKLSESQDKNV